MRGKRYESLVLAGEKGQTRYTLFLRERRCLLGTREEQMLTDACAGGGVAFSEEHPSPLYTSDAADE